MSTFTGAPIMNNGYYDVPINNQYSNQPYPRDNISDINDYNFNQKIALTVNDNKENYRYLQRPTVPATSLYYENNNNQQGGYYQDPMFLSSDANTPLTKKKEQQICNYINTPVIESFRGGSSSSGNGGHPSVNYPEPIVNNGQYTQMTYPNNRTTGYLNTQAMPNISRNYWDYNDPSYTNYTFVPQPEYINPSQQPEYINPSQQSEYINSPIMQRPEYINSQQKPKYINPPIMQRPEYINSPQRPKYINPPNIPSKIFINSNLKEDKQDKKKIKKNTKSNKKNNTFSMKTLWNIIIILIIIILLFIFKIMYDNKIITFKK